MRLFTSSSETLPVLSRATAAAGPVVRPRAVGRLLHRIRCERLLLVAVFALPLIVATAAIHQPQDRGLQTDNFWAMKLGWQACADCVLAGDSRVGTGLSPAAMAPWLPGRRILNFGFDSARYSADYLDAVERVLDRAGRQCAVVLGITPMSLLPTAGGRGGFERLRGDTRRLSRCELLALRGARFVAPMRLDTVARELNPRNAREVVTVRWPDGWIAYSPPRGRSFVVHLLESTFGAQQVDPATEELLLARVRAWTASGVRVYAFRPPTCPETIEVEGRLSGFDEQDFARQFEAAGGVWLAIPPLGYDSSDGSHLYPEAAVALSRDVARAVGG